MNHDMPFEDLINLLYDELAEFYATQSLSSLKNIESIIKQLREYSDGSK